MMLYGGMYHTTPGRWDWVSYQPRLSKYCDKCRDPVMRNGTRSNKKDLTIDTCEWCGFVATISRQIERDHIMPLAHGGIHDASNFQYLCCNCHALKTYEDTIRFN